MRAPYRQYRKYPVPILRFWSLIALVGTFPRAAPFGPFPCYPRFPSQIPRNEATPVPLLVVPLLVV